MTDISSSTAARQRIALARAGRPAVDSNGRPIDGAQSVYTYGDGGRLVSVTTPEPDESH